MATDGTSLGDRMKEHERAYRYVLPRRTYTILRVDGRAFHNLTKELDRPYDEDFMLIMDAVAMELCYEVQGARLAYVQSDEISVLYTDFEAPGTQAWFGGVLAKQISIGAAIASQSFNSTSGITDKIRTQAEFDARVFTLSDPVEVANYFLWRQQDATRNSILMAGQAYFSHRELQGKSTGEVQEMLWSQKQVNWNDYPEGFKRGRVIVPGGGWAAMPAPIFKAEPLTFLADMIPQMPSLR